MIYFTPYSYTVLSEVEALLERLEEPEFDAEFHLASDVHHSLRMMRANDRVRALSAHLRRSPRSLERVLERLHELSERVIDLRWSSPHESSIVGILVAIEGSFAELLPHAASLVENVPNAPWVARIVAGIREQMPTPLPMRQVFDLPWSPAGIPSDVATSDERTFTFREEFHIERTGAAA